MRCTCSKRAVAFVMSGLSELGGVTSAGEAPLLFGDAQIAKAQATKRQRLLNDMRYRYSKHRFSPGKTPRPFGFRIQLRQVYRTETSAPTTPQPKTAKAGPSTV